MFSGSAIDLAQKLFPSAAFVLGSEREKKIVAVSFMHQYLDLIRAVKMHFPSKLGHVDGFDEDEAQSKSDEGAVVLVGLLAAQSNALESLELAHGLLDTSPPAVERLGKELRLLFGGRPMRNHGADATGAGSLPVGFGVIALVTHSRPRRDVGPKIEQGFEVRTVADLTTG
jgi:hypothetical protein